MLSLSSLNKSAKQEEISHAKEKKMTSSVKEISTVSSITWIRKCRNQRAQRQKVMFPSLFS